GDARYSAQLCRRGEGRGWLAVRRSARFAMLSRPTSGRAPRPTRRNNSASLRCWWSSIRVRAACSKSDHQHFVQPPEKWTREGQVRAKEDRQRTFQNVV